MGNRLTDSILTWDPRAADVTAPRARRRPTFLLATASLAVLVGLTLLDKGGAAAVWGLVLLVAGVAHLTAPLWRARLRTTPRAPVTVAQLQAALATTDEPIEVLDRIVRSSQGHVFLGLVPSTRGWVMAEPEHAVMVLGPPRSGKTSAIIIPALLTAPGAVVSTSTKLDVMQATAGYRSLRGRVWVYDPSGTEALPSGAARLRWSPVNPRRSWDQALVVARAMVDAAQVGSGTDSEYWNERAGALIAGLLHAAAVSGRDVQDLRRWVLRHDLVSPSAALASSEAHLAFDVLDGLSRASDATLSSIFSTAASALSTYNSEAALRNCEAPNFDADAFVRSADTLYISAPAHLQAQVAPLVVGLLEEIRNAAYARARGRRLGFDEPPVMWALDEVANIAPLNSLPAVISEGGGQGLQVIACLQDLSQARGRWGQAADGFLSLFAIKLVFGGIGDLETLRAMSAYAGTWDRPYTSVTRSTSRSGGWSDPARDFGGSRTDAIATTTSVHREAVLTEGDIAQIPRDHALMLASHESGLVVTERYFASRTWHNVLSSAPVEILERGDADGR